MIPKLPDDQWTNAYPHVTIEWDDCSIGFACICGEPGLIISEEDKTCDECGRVYRLVTRFEVYEPAEVADAKKDTNTLF